MSPLAALIRDDALVGRAPEDLDGARAERIGRALGTLVRRRGLPRASFLLAAAGEGQPGGELGRGLARGLLLSGHDVTLIGDIRPGAQLDARGAGAKACGAWLETDGEDARLVLVALGQRLGRADLEQLCTLVERGDFAAGQGALHCASLMALTDDERAVLAEATTQVGAYPTPELAAAPPGALVDNPALDDVTLDDLFASGEG